MKFIKIRNEFNAIRAAGYTFDPAAERQIDRDLYRALCQERGERWTDGKLDELFDMDGALYQGEDGSMYAVQEVFEDAGMVPLCWHRLCKEEKK